MGLADLPKVSILIPTYNRDRFLKEAIESSLRQDYSNIEIIVSDNASTDNTRKIAEQYLGYSNFKYFRNDKNYGMVANWRKLLYEYCTGEWIIILSDDDYFIYDSYISEAISLIQKGNNIFMVYAFGYINYTKTNKFVKLDLPYKDITNGNEIFLNRDLVVKPIDFTLCNILFNTKVTKQLNAFSNHDNICCDSELFLNMCLLGNVGIIKKYATVYRYHDNNLVLARRSPEELIAMSDMIMHPYYLALEQKMFSSTQLSDWKNRLLKKYFKHVVRELIINNRSCFFITLKTLRGICNYSYISIVIHVFLDYKLYGNILRDYLKLLKNNIIKIGAVNHESS